PARPARGTDRGRRLLEAPRRGTDVRLCAADVHHRGRDRQADPPDGHNAPVRQLRRIERCRQLHPARGPPARIQPRGGETVNPRIRNVALVAIVLLAALVIGTTYWQAWAVGYLADKQDNAIQQVAQFKIQRGVIRAANGVVLASNRARRAKDGQTYYFRHYPSGS